MDPFSYLSVLLSIILGLGITQLLTAFGRLIRGRTHVRFDWPPLLAAAVLLVIYVQVWWSMFGFRERAEWTFVAFLIVLLQTVTLYMAAALVLPESVSEPSDETPGGPASVDVADLRAHYERQAPWFFGFLVATVLTSVLKEVVFEGRLPVGANLAFHAFLLVAFGLAMVVRRRAFHEGLAIVNVVVVAAYIGALFYRLR